jgi:hypothetical protein
VSGPSVDDIPFETGDVDIGFMCAPSLVALHEMDLRASSYYRRLRCATTSAARGKHLLGLVDGPEMRMLRDPPFKGALRLQAMATIWPRKRSSRRLAGSPQTSRQ